MGCFYWPGSDGIWSTDYETNKSCSDLSKDQKPKSCSAAPWPCQLESTVRYLGVEVEDALEVSEEMEV